MIHTRNKDEENDLSLVTMDQFTVLFDELSKYFKEVQEHLENKFDTLQAQVLHHEAVPQNFSQTLAQMETYSDKPQARHKCYICKKTCTDMLFPMSFNLLLFMDLSRKTLVQKKIFY